MTFEEWWEDPLSNVYLLCGGTQSKAQARATWNAAQEAEREACAAKESEIARLHLRITEMAGDIVTILDIIPPGENAVKNWSVVLDHLRSQREAEHVLAQSAIKAMEEERAEIAHLKECQASQREQLRLLEELQDGEIAEHVRLAEECKDKEIARLRALVSAGQDVVNALENCECSRGRFSCAPNHDCRCERDRGISGKCTCYAEELEQAVSRWRSLEGMETCASETKTDNS